MKIGDHEFHQGVCQICGRHWADLRHVTMEHAGQMGIACRGVLLHSEVPDYLREREREDRGIDQAFNDLARY